MSKTKQQQQLLAKDLLTQDQIDAVTRLYEHDHTLMISKMGGGKTITTLTAIAELIADGVIESVLIVAPLKVCKTVWAQEALKWEHTCHLTISICVGNEQRRREALNENSQITVINFENLPWLFKTMKARCWWDGLVIDEISKMKNSGGTQFRALRPRLVDYTWRVGLTGTPVSEDWEGLFGQMLIVDNGATFGTRKAAYLEKYFYPTDFNRYNWAMHDWSAAEITAKITPFIHVMPDYRDQLPPIRYETVEVDMPDTVREAYREMSENFIVENLPSQDAAFSSFAEVEAPNAAVMISKLQQIACGFVYGSDGEAINLSDFRIDAAIELIKRQPRTLFVYQHQNEFLRIKAALDAHFIPFVAIADGDAEAICSLWNDPDSTVRVLLLHPKSAGHGLNLAAGGACVIWYAPQWSNDLWEQTNARLWRRGQTKPVLVQTLAARDSVDQLVINRVQKKHACERLLMSHLEQQAKARAGSVTGGVKKPG